MEMTLKSSKKEVMARANLLRATHLRASLQRRKACAAATTPKGMLCSCASCTELETGSMTAKLCLRNHAMQHKDMCKTVFANFPLHHIICCKHFRVSIKLDHASVKEAYNIYIYIYIYTGGSLVGVHMLGA